MFVTNWISTTKIQKISEITNFFRHYFLSRTEVKIDYLCKLKSRTEILAPLAVIQAVPIAVIQAVPIAVIAWYRLHRYAWYRYSAIVKLSPNIHFSDVILRYYNPTHFPLLRWHE